MNMTDYLNMYPVSGPVFDLSKAKRDYVYMANAIIVPVVAAENLDANTVVSINDAGKIRKANLADGYKILGMLITDTDAGVIGYVQRHGRVFIDNTTYVTGTRIYAHDDGLWSDSASDVFLGIITKLGELELQPHAITDSTGIYVPLNRQVNSYTLDDDVVIDPDDLDDSITTNKFLKPSTNIDCGTFL